MGVVQGKPSAGKSTFFNAAVGQDLAKTGAFPFTTIEPNVKQTVYAIPCPCQKWERQCDSGNYATSGIQETCNKWERQCDSGNHATSGIQETTSEVGETV